jgi:hypothetical protein
LVRDRFVLGTFRCDFGLIDVYLFLCHHRPVSDLTVQMVPLNELVPDPDNPRNNSSAIAKVAASIRKFGFKVPLVINAEHKILAGHTRFLAASMLKLEEVPCVIADDLDADEQVGFSLAENRSSDFSFWDLGKLAEMADSIDEETIAEFDLDSLLAGIEVEDIDVPAEAKPEKREGLDLAPFEKYQYLMIICRSTYDFTNLLDRFGLENIQERYVGRFLKRGTTTGRVIEYPEFVAVIDKES